MFGWLFGKKKLPGFYEPKERQIFTYWNGQKQIYADPMELFRKYLSMKAEMDVDIKVSRSKSKDADSSYTKYVEKLRILFDVKSLSDNGLTEVEIQQVFYSFIDFCNNVKKNSETLSTTSKPIPVSESTTSGEELHSNNTSQSGSTETGQSTEGQIPLRPELE